MRAAFLRTGPEAIDYLEARTDVQFVPCGKHPDYRGNLPGAGVFGRAIVPKPFDGRLLGADFSRVRPPIPEYLLLGGMMVGKDDIPPLIGRFKSAKNFLYAARLVARYLADRLRFPRGTRLMMGNALVARLFYSLKKRNVPVLFGAALTDLIGDPHGITGARLRQGDRDIVVTARKGVVLATGGFGHNKTFRQKFMPQPTPAHSLACDANLGDGVALGLTLGARIAPEKGRGGLWTPVSITRRRDGTEGLYPHLSLDRPKPGLLAVNATGRRFVNEACSYHDFVEAMFERHTDRAVDPGLAGLRRDVHREIRARRHPSWRARRRAVPAQRLHRQRRHARRAGAEDRRATPALAETVARHNRFAETGVDEDFGKGETELNRFNGDARHGPNPCIGALVAPPFHAIAVWPAEIAVSTGLSTDDDARVLDAEGRPIAGLYACGNDMASVMGGAYPGPGTTLGPAAVFAYRAVMHARGPDG